MKLFYALIFQCILFYGVSQNVDIINSSGFKHNYLVSGVECLEDMNDTARIQFMARIKISSENNSYLLSEWHNILRAIAKRLQANVFYIENYTENKDGISATIKLFFASANFLKLNRAKGDKNNIYVFNLSRSEKDTACFYLNQKKINFKATQYFYIKTEPYKLYKFSLHKNNSKNKTESFPKNKESAYFILPLKLSPSYKRNKPIKCNYNLGRFLVALYKTN